MKTLFAKTALLPSGWQENVQIEIDPSGFIHRVETQVRPNSVAETVVGPVIAGVANVHSHVWQRLIAGLTESRGDFWVWREHMYRYAHKLQPEQLHAVAAQTYVDMLKAGYTCVGEFHYLHHAEDGKAYSTQTEMSDQVIEAALVAGIRITHLPVLYQHSNFGSKKPKRDQRRFLFKTDAFNRLLDDLEKRYSTQNMVTIGWAPHSLRAVNAKAIRAVLAEKGGPVHIHIAEQPKEVADCLNWCGERPVAWLLDNFQVNANWCLVHATHTQVRELRGIAKSGATVAVCPTTEANLGDGIFPSEKFLSVGGKIAIGSDSHISIDPAEELRLLEYGQRLTKGKRGILTTEELPSVGGRLFPQAQLAGQQALNNSAGSIARGAPADLVVLDGKSSLLQGKTKNQILDTWIFSGGRSLVRDVMTAGQWRVTNGAHVNEAAIAAKFAAVIAELSET